MRLSTCVALELLVGASLISGLGVSVSWGVQEVRAKWYREARAAEASRSLLSEQLPASVAASESQALTVPNVDTSAKVETWRMPTGEGEDRLAVWAPKYYHDGRSA